MNVDQHWEQAEVSSSMPVGLQTRSKTKVATLCCTPENLRTSSTPDCVSAMNPDGVHFCLVYFIISDSEEDTDPSSSVTVDDPIDEISSLCEDISEPNCSDSHHPNFNDMNTTKHDVITVKAKSTFSFMCWFYYQGAGRCQEHGYIYLSS